MEGEEFVTCNVPFEADKINLFNSFKFSWQISFMTDKCWIDGGSSDNQVYVTLKDVPLQVDSQQCL